MMHLYQTTPMLMPYSRIVRSVLLQYVLTGYDDEGCLEMMRLYQTIHADHEGGNVSAHATHLVRWLRCLYCLLQKHLS